MRSPEKEPDYAPHTGAFIQQYTKTAEHLAKANAEDVASTIFQAATDGQPRLRYVVDEDFVKKMRANLLP